MLLDIAATGAMGGTGHLHGLRPRGGQRRGAWPGVRVACVNAAHILGSASILVELTEGETRRRVLLSGDIGNSGRPLLMNPVVPEDIDVAAMESTCADRNHRQSLDTVAEFCAAVVDAFRRNGNVVIQTFRLERAQEMCGRASTRNKLALSMHVFLNSPGAISAPEIFQRHPESCRPRIAELFAKGIDPLGPPGLVFARETTDSIA